MNQKAQDNSKLSSSYTPNKDDDSKKGLSKNKNWKQYAKSGNFYLHGMVYMLARIAVNVTMSIQPFYLKHVTGFTGNDSTPTPLAIAITPLLSYITSLVFSLFLYEAMVKRLKNRVRPMFVATIVIACSSVPLLVSLDFLTFLS